MKPSLFTLTTTGTAATWIANRDIQTININVSVTLTGGTTSYTLEHCYNLGAATPRWFTNGSAKTASAEVTYVVPVEAIRINVSALSGGNLEVNYLQAGVA